MNRHGQMEIEPVGVLGAVLGGVAAFFIQKSAGLGFIWNILAFVLGAVAGYFITAKIMGGN